MRELSPVTIRAYDTSRLVIISLKCHGPESGGGIIDFGCLCNNHKGWTAIVIVVITISPIVLWWPLVNIWIQLVGGSEHSLGGYYPLAVYIDLRGIPFCTQTHRAMWIRMHEHADAINCSFHIYCTAISIREPCFLCRNCHVLIVATNVSAISACKCTSVCAFQAHFCGYIAEQKFKDRNHSVHSAFYWFIPGWLARKNAWEHWTKLDYGNRIDVRWHE